jgi:hypothetical protein
MFTRIAGFVIGLLLAAMTPADAQLQLRPTDPPRVTATNESWYVQREPIDLGGELYFRAGPSVFFDGNVMARIGHYNGVPIYMDTTIEPYSVILVPILRGQMQQYERRRRGDLAGTTASRTPSFPVTVMPDNSGLLEAGAPPTFARASIGTVGAFTRSEAVMTTPERSAGTSGVQSPDPAPSSSARSNGSIGSARTPDGNGGLWILFRGERWVNAGAAVPLRATEFRMVGTYSGFPVFARNDQHDRIIYIPTRAGLIAPYKVKPQ